MEDETNKEIKKIWEKFFEIECSHLKEAIRLLEKHENKSFKSVIGDGEFPLLLAISSNKEYVRNVIVNTANMTSKAMGYESVDDMPKDCTFCYYQDGFIGKAVEEVPSHQVIVSSIEKFGKDYRYEDSPHPIEELQNREKVNTTFARKKT